jgi:hypothetical protein
MLVGYIIDYMSKIYFHISLKPVNMIFDLFFKQRKHWCLGAKSTFRIAPCYKYMSERKSFGRSTLQIIEKRKVNADDPNCKQQRVTRATGSHHR